MPFPGLVPGPALFAAAVDFPVVEATNTNDPTDSASTTFAVPLPASIQSGELLLMFISLRRSSGASSLSTPSGWTELFQVTGPGILRAVAAYYKTATGSEGATVNVTASNLSAWGTVSMRVSGAGLTPEASATSSGSASAPDSGSLTPSWGNTKTLWFTASGYIEGGLTAPPVPTDYGNAVRGYIDLSGDQSPGTIVARRELQAASEDPGAWGTTVGEWVAVTVGVEPA